MHSKAGYSSVASTSGARSQIRCGNRGLKMKVPTTFKCHLPCPRRASVVGIFCASTFLVRQIPARVPPGTTVRHSDRFALSAPSPPDSTCGLDCCMGCMYGEVGLCNGTLLVEYPWSPNTAVVDTAPCPSPTHLLPPRFVFALPAVAWPPSANSTPTAIQIRRRQRKMATVRAQGCGGRFRRPFSTRPVRRISHFGG